MAFVLIIVVLIIIIIVIGNIKLINNINNKELLVKEKWKKIKSCHQERNKLVIKICDSIKKYNSDSKLIPEVIEITNKLVKNESINNDIELNRKIIKKLNNLFEESKGYKELITNKNFISNLKKMKLIDDEVKDNKYFYNEAVEDYNKYIESKKVYFIAAILKKKKYLLYK